MGILRKLAGFADENKNDISVANKMKQLKTTDGGDYKKQRHCNQCGSVISESDKFCGGCGEKITSNKKIVKTKAKKKGFAVASLVCGIIGGYPIFSVASIIAIVCGHIAFIKVKKNPNEYTGKKMAIAGLILGYLGLAIAIILGIMRGLLEVQLKGLTL